MKRPIHIFKAGTHTAMDGQTIEFTADTVKAIAENYNSEAFSAPIVVGHPKDNSPAFGWVEGLQFKAGNLYATLKQVNSDFAELVKNGTYKKVSASFYPPDSAANPNKGQYSLRHIGFLGGMPPAVKGLEQVQFGEVDCLTVEFGEFEAPYGLGRMFRNLKNWLIQQEGVKIADDVLPEYMIDSIVRAVENQHDEKNYNEQDQEDLIMDQKELEAKAKDIEDREAKIAEAEAKLNAEANFAEAKQVVDKLVADGKVLPAQATEVTQFVAGLNNSQTVEFGEGDTTKQTQRKFWENWMANAPKVTPDTGKVDVEKTDFAEDNALAVVAAANKIVAESGGAINYVEAVKQVNIHNS